MIKKEMPSKENILNEIGKIKLKTKDRFVKLLISQLEEGLSKTTESSFIEFVEFERIKNLFEKENRRSMIKSSLNIPEKEQVYAFRVSLAKGIWRIIEIKGGTLLSRFSSIIQSSFGHEPCHLYEFEFNKHKFGPRCDEWEEIFDGLDNIRLDSALNSIGFKVGETGKFLYDFGENIKHTLKLLEIKNLQQDIEYPKIEGSKETYRCENCKTKDAELFCHRCRQKLCEECSESTPKNITYCSEGHYPLLEIYEK